MMSSLRKKMTILNYHFIIIIFNFLITHYCNFLFFLLQVKRNVSDLTNIPVRHQQWEGWPASASDDSVRHTFNHCIFLTLAHKPR